MGVPMLLGPDGKPLARRAEAAQSTRRQIQARYDAARTTDENRRHWANADGLSAREANSAEVRYRLRTRARYEVANNSYAKGMSLTLANDLIGTGPRLQMLSEDPEANRRVERSFEDWTSAVSLAELLRTKKHACTSDGESFALLTTNPAIDHPVRLCPRLIEADQVATPDLVPNDPLAVDGIRLDEHMNPVAYHVLKSHPGDAFNFGIDYDVIPARYVIHWFRHDRPGQFRGVPEITPALPLFAQLRRYTLAVLAAAETAADFAAVLYSDLNPDDEPYNGEPFEALEINRRLMTVLPSGHKMGQFEANQPTTTYSMFKREILTEIARCLNVPFNVAAGDSSSYNYASGRLDHQTYDRAIAVEQYHLETAVLNPLFAAWAENYALVSPDELPPNWSHRWFFDGREHVDPAKEAAAQSIRLKSHTTTLADEYARRGLDWEVQLRQRAKELELMKELGLSVQETAPARSRSARN